MSFKCLSVHSQLEYEFGAYMVYPQSIICEDINDDGKNELVIGTGTGEILTYKGTISSSYLKFKIPGSITCILFDDVRNLKRKNLIVMNSIGYVYVLSVNQMRKRYTSDASTTKKQPSDFKFEIKEVCNQKLLPNPKYVFSQDIDNDGLKELIVSTSDRRVYIYRWQSTSSANISNSGSQNTLQESENGKFLLLQAFELSEQIDSICAVQTSFSNNYMLLATQPGSKIRECKLKAQLDSSSSSSSSLSEIITVKTKTSEQKPVAKPIALTRQISEIINEPEFLRSEPLEFKYSSTEEIFSLGEFQSSKNIKSPTFLIPDVSHKKQNNFAYFLTMNGDVFFFNMSENLKDKNYIWYRDLQSPILFHYKANLIDDGNEYLITANSDGMMHIISPSGDILLYDLGEPIHAFYVGLYSLENVQQNVTSFDFDWQSAMELHVDPPANKTIKESYGPLKNKLCAIFLSTVTNKVCIVPFDYLLAQARLKNSIQLKFKCNSIIYQKHLLDCKQLAQMEENEFEKSAFNLLYSNKLEADSCEDFI